MPIPMRTRAADVNQNLTRTVCLFVHGLSESSIFLAGIQIKPDYGRLSLGPLA